MGKIDDTQAYKEWAEYHHSLKRDKVTDNLPPVERKKKLEKLEVNVIEQILFFFSKFAKYPFTKFHKKAIKRITMNMEWCEALSWLRELAEPTTVFMCMMYLVLTGKKKNVLLIPNGHENAARFLEPHKKAFESNSMLKAYYGDLREFESRTVDEFTFTTGVAFWAIGALESPHDTRKDAVCPDTAPMDDFDTGADRRNLDILKKKWEWFEKALFSIQSISKDSLVISCGNPIALDCCARCAGGKADHWDIMNIQDKDGKPSWSGRNMEEHISRIQSKISVKTFQQEYMNNPLPEGDTFKEMVWGKCPPPLRLQFAVVYGDPAPSNSKNKTTSSKACFLIGYYDGKFYVYTGYLGHVVNEEYVDWYYYLRDHVGQKTQVYNYIENNKLQDPFHEQVFVPLFNEKEK